MASSFPHEPLPGPSGECSKIKDRILNKVAMFIGEGWKCLGLELDIEKEELDDIIKEYSSEGVREMAFEMLRLWRSKLAQGATLDVLVEALQEMGRDDVADKILLLSGKTATVTRTPGVAEMPQAKKQNHSPELNSYKEILKGDCIAVSGQVNVGGTQTVHQQTIMHPEPDLGHAWTNLQASLQINHEKLQIPKIPWIDWELEFDQYYVDLSIQSKSDEETKDLQLQKIFTHRDRKNPSRILIEGPAGYGKSTLALKLCYDHAKKEKYIQHFNIVILLRLREFEKSLDNLIIETLNLKDYRRKEVLEAIKLNQSKVLFVLDGLDELSQGKMGDIVSLLKGNRLPQSTVIVTSRVGSRPIQLKDGKKESTNILNLVDRRLLIKGVKETNRREFLQMYLKESPEKLAAVLNLVKKKYNLLFRRKLFDCPLFLLLLIIVAEESDIRTLKTKTDLYKTLFNFILRRMLTKQGKTDTEWDFFDYNRDDPPDYVQMLRKFGSLAMHALREKKYAFTDEEIRSHVGDDNILKLGILTQNDCKTGKKRKSWFEPVHLSFLEFSAAYSAWANLIHHVKLTFSLNIVDILYINKVNAGSLMVPFFLGLCIKQRAVSFLQNFRISEIWLELFMKPENSLELLTEGQINYSDMVEVLTHFIPAGFISDYVVDVNLWKDVFTKAVNTGRLKSLITICKGAVKRQITSRNNKDYLINNLKSLSRDSEAVKHRYEKRVVPRNISKINVILNGNDHMHLAEIITHQNLSLRRLESSDFKLKVKLTFCEASLEDQLKYLSSWISIKGFCIDKPIHEIEYRCDRRNSVLELFCIITELIRNENVERLEIKIKDSDIPPVLWVDLFYAANRSKRLLDIRVSCEGMETIVVDIAGSEGKVWRLIELIGEIVPQFVPQSISSAEQNERYFNNGIEHPENYLDPDCIQYLSVEPGNNKRVFVQNQNCNESLVYNLRELHFKIREVCQVPCTRSLIRHSYLQVLVFQFHKYFEFSKYELSNFLSGLSYHHSLMRLELHGMITGEFLIPFLLNLSEVKWSERKTEEQKTMLRLDTLVLGDGNFNEGPRLGLSKSSVDLLKKLLKSGQLRHLRVFGRLDKKNLNRSYIKSFYPSEGFVAEVFLKKETDFYSTAYDTWQIEISYEKGN